jgi:abortive infection bacteriophage resistance protein
MKINRTQIFAIVKIYCNFVLNNTSHASHLNSAPGLVFDFYRVNLILSKIFQNLKKCPEKLAVTSHFGLKDVSIIENWILCFSSLRNICAHHGRVWNRRLVPIKIPTYPTHPFLKNKSIYPNKLYGTLSCIEYVLRLISSDSTMSESLKELMKTCPLAQTKEMGFPNNWLDEELWN